MEEKKHVTIDPSSTKSPSENGTTVYRGMHIPKHMLSPGQDGYRTPTFEDYEMQKPGSKILNGASTPNGTATPIGHSTSNSLHHRRPHTPRHLNLSSTSLPHSILDKLHWRERIRHYTWTFFTMTMATGGISNVLYNGKLGPRGPGCPSRS